LEDVGWLVPEIAFAPQPMSHRGDVGSHSTNHRCCSASFAGGGLASC
jgi:hypothetical protein